MAGYIYAWKVPITLSAPTLPDEQLCLVKVGKAEPHRLWRRLYDQHLSWRKLLGVQLNENGVLRVKTIVTRRYPVIDLDSQSPSIPYSTEDLTQDETADKCDEVFEDLEDYVDFGFFLKRSEEHHINDDEQYIRALLGLPARPTFISRIVEAWNRETKYSGKVGVSKVKKIAAVKEAQIGYSEFIITTVAQFNQVRDAFKECNSADDFSLEKLTTVLSAATNFVRTVSGINISVKLPMENPLTEIHCIRFTSYVHANKQQELEKLLSEGHIHE